jgi:hypothetical protein
MQGVKGAAKIWAASSKKREKKSKAAAADWEKLDEIIGEPQRKKQRHEPKGAWDAVIDLDEVPLKENRKSKKRAKN